jgi:predicted ATP-dependent endonuclease of OLD family
MPNELLDGSGITYIVGVNNSGKTTIIEGLSISKDRKISKSEKNGETLPELTLYSGKSIVRKCSIIRPESYTIEESPILPEEQKFRIVSSRRHWDSNASSTYASIEQGLKNSQGLTSRKNEVLVAALLKKIESNEDEYDEFISLVKRIVPEFTKFAVGFDEQEFIEYISGSGIRHKSDLLGDGVITVIRILLQLYEKSSAPLIIDEPELSLHPSAQKKLLKLLGEFSKKRQIIISTHSPYFISWGYLKNGAVLNRVVKTGDIKSEIFSVTNVYSYESLINGSNWQQPYLLDEVAKEIFFSEDNILFLEGQEDVGLLRDEEILKDINIFGYGVRGKDNFKFALKLAKDLGYKKVCCLLDRGESEDYIKADLEKGFTSDFCKVVQWDRNDIRDKPIYTSVEKIGYFTKDGEKKENIGDFNKKMTEIKKYLFSATQE